MTRYLAMRAYKTCLNLSDPKTSTTEQREQAVVAAKMRRANNDETGVPTLQESFELRQPLAIARAEKAVTKSRKIRVSSVGLACQCLDVATAPRFGNVRPAAGRARL